MAISDLYTPARIQALQAQARQAGLAALLFTPGADLRYLTGYDIHASERLTCLVIPAEGETTLIVPKLERPAAEASPAPGVGVAIVDHADGSDPYPLVVAALAAGGPLAGVIGLGERMWAEHALPIIDALPGMRARLAGHVIRELRMRKTPAEIEALAQAGAAIDRVHARMGEWLRAGRAEVDVAADIRRAIVEEGHVAADFAIVAAGPDGASPHHDSGARVIAPGDPVVVDIGGVMPSGYRSDSTRQYLIGGADAPDGFADCYQVLQAAQRAACAAVRPGATCAQVDAAARDLIAEAGWGEAFLHRTGHGIGLDGHEEPYIAAGNDLPLEPGMAFSIEPGIYLAGRCGARIEDIVVCVEDGACRLNILPTDLVTL